MYSARIGKGQAPRAQIANILSQFGAPIVTVRPRARLQRSMDFMSSRSRNGASGYRPRYRIIAIRKTGEAEHLYETDIPWLHVDRPPYIRQCLRYPSLRQTHMRAQLEGVGILLIEAKNKREILGRLFGLAQRPKALRALVIVVGIAGDESSMARL